MTAVSTNAPSASGIQRTGHPAHRSPAARSQCAGTRGRPEPRPTTLKAGEVFFVPAETFHAVRNVGGGNAAELATYFVEKGKPLAS
jgi:hypothetical protein